MDIKDMTPAEIDQLWIEALAPSNAKFEQAARRRSTADKYRRAGGRYIADADRIDAEVSKLYAEARELRDVVSAPFQAEWDARGGWTRAYVVPEGHIHRSTSCHTLHPTTRIAWLPEQSGMSEDEIVKAAGIHACTVCYPSAPVEALRAAEKAAKAATECPGSRSYSYEPATFKRTSHTGSGRAICSHCGERVGVSTIGKMKAHPKKETNV